ncbi:DNA cytosine methyltransferase [Micromonospora endophytica]|uniref:DNA (Cytosine-5-)-methyltransferase n=1 Tax=Micromonospora endophytica TaxID=515350 RepID=A0A2W2CVX1_9ACTN|nr:DNA cytosine methyltransferase [Micromonospora endophytica]PZF97454.1 DNA (cytosine-5-)-methyltransferase [Micromonospora endophytica]RIW41363.1 DNA (cytosine-5-)-methyltransferase [Micromonospora endophytica]BCJ58337.1 cytosine-specific methyltransferase [Micromonospora endophytica]
MLEQLEEPVKDRTSVELFAGGGGLAMAVHRAGFRPLLVNELVKYACDTLLANVAVRRGDEERIPGPNERWPLVSGDVSNVQFEYLWDRVDLLAGGPPCQPFSLGGIAKGDEDKRNMFPQMFRAIREIQPKAVICENVRGLLRPSFKPYFEYIERELRLPFIERDETTNWREHDEVLRDRLAEEPTDPKQRYDVVTMKVNAADYGVPQVRNRIIIVAFRSDLGIDMQRFEQAVSPRYSEAALIRSMLDGTYWERHPDVPGHVRERLMARLPDTPPKEDGMLPWRTLRDAIKGIDGQRPLPPVPWDRLDRREYGLGGLTDHIGWPDARIYPGHTPNELDRPAKTVKAGVHGVPGGESVMLTDDLLSESTAGSPYAYKHRYMTVRETARVMTFPDGWKLAGPRGEQMRQLGNAVPVMLGEFFARAIAAALDEAEGTP